MKTIITSLLLINVLIGCSVNHVPTKAEERYCIVVEEVKIGKHGAIIRPKSQVKEIKKLKKWYRYPTPNISVGDTVDVSDSQLLTGPRF